MEKTVKWTTVDTFLRVNSILMFFQEEFGFPKCGKIFSGHLEGKKVKTFVKHGDASHWGTNFSKLVNSYAVKTFFLISTPVYNKLIKNNRNVYIYIKCYTAQAKKKKSV